MLKPLSKRAKQGVQMARFLSEQLRQGRSMDQTTALLRQLRGEDPTTASGRGKSKQQTQGENEREAMHPRRAWFFSDDSRTPGKVLAIRLDKVLALTVTGVPPGEGDLVGVQVLLEGAPAPLEFQATRQFYEGALLEELGIAVRLGLSE